MLSCKRKDIGIDCHFEATAETEEELMKIIMEKIKKVIKKYNQ